jgi:hypothetical protein
VTWVHILVWHSRCAVWRWRMVTQDQWHALRHVEIIALSVLCAAGAVTPLVIVHEARTPVVRQNAPVDVPEPGGLGLLGIGVVGLWRIKKGETVVRSKSV